MRQYTTMNFFQLIADSKNLKKLTNEELEEFSPYYSPDKSYVAFIVSNGKQSAIFILQLSDGTFKKVTLWYDNKDLEAVTDITFSQDSKRIFFTVTSGDSYNLNMLDMDDGVVKTIVSDAKGIDIYGWSYDGKMLALQSQFLGEDILMKNKSFVLLKMMALILGH